MDLQARIAANRFALADFSDRLEEDQLQVQSLCASWTVREVLGHLVTTLTGSTTHFVWQVVRARGSLDRASTVMSQQASLRPIAELTAIVRDNADVQIKAPGIGPMGQMADARIHLRDCARPLGLNDSAESQDWSDLLDWLCRGVPGLVPRRRLDGL